MIITDAFKTIKREPSPEKNGRIYGQDYLDKVSGMQVGMGTKVMRVDQSGMWLGGSEFADAPFSVDMLGQLITSLLTIKNSEGETVIDSTGVVSGTVFPFDIASGTGNQTLTDSIVDVTGVTVSFTLSRAARVLFFAEGRVEVQTADDAYFYADLDGSTICQPQGVRFVVNGDFYSKMTYDVKEVDAGNHTFKMRANKAAGATAELSRADSRVAYLVLGS